MTDYPKECGFDERWPICSDRRSPFTSPRSWGTAFPF